MFIHGLDPIPTNLPETIPLLRDTFLFWRISKGGPGCPKKGALGHGHARLGEFPEGRGDLDVILFLYDHSGTRPRAREEAATNETCWQIGRRACLALLIASYGRDDGIGARDGSRRRNEAQRGGGKAALPPLSREASCRSDRRERGSHPEFLVPSGNFPGGHGRVQGPPSSGSPGPPLEIRQKRNVSRNSGIVSGRLVGIGSSPWMNMPVRRGYRHGRRRSCDR